MGSNWQNVWLLTTMAMATADVPALQPRRQGRGPLNKTDRLPLATEEQKAASAAKKKARRKKNGKKKRGY